MVGRWRWHMELGRGRVVGRRIFLGWRQLWWLQRRRRGLLERRRWRLVMANITSSANARIKSLSKLKTRRGRAAKGRFLIEGSREVGRATTAGIDLDEIIYCAALATDSATSLADLSAAPVTTVAEAPFAKLSHRQHPDGIIAVARTWDADLAALSGDLALIAESIEKPGNLGAMLRTANAAGAAVVVADATVDLFNPNVVRASQGALFTIPVAVTDAETAARWAAGRGLVVVTTPKAESSLWETDLTGPIAIVVGSEHKGVSQVWHDVGTPVRIPMAGDGDSLNASIAAAVALFEAVRQRG